MSGRAVASLALLSLALSGCLARKWAAGPTTLVSDQQIALALGEHVEVEEAFDARSLVDIQAPSRVRPCCAFGMDLTVAVAGMTVPGYSVGNIIGVGDLGHHEYDNGAATLTQDLGRIVTLESNGLVYTCRGGFVDTAHVRDNADLTLFLTTRIVAALPGPTIIKLDGDGAVRRVVVKAVPPGLVERMGRWETALALAQWSAFQISIWHEIVTFYDYESVPGFSEKVSAFSPEDFYSNAIGARIAAGILRSQRIHARSEWDSLVDAWIPATLKRLGAVSPDLGRRAMKSLDSRWWDSTKKLPDWTLVKRRKMDIGTHVMPWRFPDAHAPADDVLEAACANHPTALPLDIPDRLGEGAISDLVTVDFEVGSWVPADMPFADPASRRLTAADFPTIVTAVRRAAEKTLGAGFDQPGPAPASAPAPTPPPAAEPTPAPK